MASATTVQSKTARRSSNGNGPLKIVDLYLLAHVIQSTMRGLLWFGGLLVIAGMISTVRSSLANGLGFDVMWQLVLYQMPRVILFALPMSVLYGTTQAFTELSSESEITALWASGLSLPRMMIAPLCWSVFLAVVAFGIQEVIVPGAQMRMDSVKRQAIQGLGKGGFRWDDPPRGKGPLKRLIQAARLDASTGTLVKPVIQFFNDQQRIEREITADAGKWDMDTNQWRLVNARGSQYGYDKFGRWMPRGWASAQSVGNMMPSLGRLINNNTNARMAMEVNNYEYVSIAEVWAYREAMYAEKFTARTAEEREGAALRVKSATFAIHDKIATPLVCIALVLIGAPLGLRPPRAKGQSGVALGLCLGVLVVYYMTWTWSNAVAKPGLGNPMVFAYLPFAITFASGLVLLERKSR